MESDTLFVFALIAAAAAAMASNRIRFDIIALLVVIALMLSGVLTVSESLSGFGSPVVILVAGLLIVGEMLDRTGVAAAIGDWILGKGGSGETRLIAIVMASAAVLGAVMSSTAVVAIFIPIVLRIAAETGISRSRLLLPMSYAALISGMLTLIATTPNLVVSEELKNAGYEEFGFFSFTPLGIAILAAGIGYMALLGRHLLPITAADEAPKQKRGRLLLELWQDYRGERIWNAIEVPRGAGQPAVNVGELQARYLITVVGIKRMVEGAASYLTTPESEEDFVEGDLLVAAGEDAALAALQAELNWPETSLTDAERDTWSRHIGAASLLVHPDSILDGKSIRDLAFDARFGLTVMGIRHAREAVPDYESRTLHPADSLLVVGPWPRVQELQLANHEFIIMETSQQLEDLTETRRKMPYALAILAVMVALSVLQWVPLVAAVLMACLAAVFTRCLSMEDSYRAIHWGSIVLVAGMLPLADALETTGGTALIVDALMEVFGEAGPLAMMSVLFFLTAALGLFLSNTASAVLVAPIAIYVAEALGVSPYPFAIAVLIAASAAFMTPVSTPVVTLVVEPGRYAFMDFVKVGVPLLLVTYVVTMVVGPLLFPL